MKTCQIIFNPECSKCRSSLDLIQSKGLQAEVIEYLEGELSEDILRNVLSLLRVKAKEILRLKEVESQGLNLDLEDDEKVINAILHHPRILERPIVIYGNKAVIGRPPEKILDIL